MIGRAMIAMVLAAGARAQSPPSPAFDVASIKVGDPNSPGGSMRTTPGGRFEAAGSTMQALVRYAYNVRDFQIDGAPSWFEILRYDITAKAAGKATTPEFRVMVQRLLAERFGLVLHSRRRNSRCMPWYPANAAPG